MIKRVCRAVVLLAGVTGLLPLSEQAGQALLSLNHCEPPARP
jgi:hypothetical protein